MNELIRTGRMSSFVIGITGTHLLADKWTSRSLEMLLEFTVEETEN